MDYFISSQLVQVPPLGLRGAVREYGNVGRIFQNYLQIASRLFFNGGRELI